MNYTNLKYFYDVGALKSVKEASKLNYVSQPAISQGIKKLENDTGLKLLNHKRNSISITTDGLALMKVASTLFDSIRQYEEEVKNIAGESSTELNIGISNSLVSNILIPTLNNFSKEYSEINVKIKIGKTSDQIKLLENGHIDLGISLDNGMLMPYRKKVLKKGKFILAGLEKSENRLLVTEQRPETILFKDSYYKKHNDITEIEIQSWNTIYELVKSGYGKGLLPDYLLDVPNIVDFSSKEKLKKPSYEIICFMKKNTRSSTVQKFIKFLSASIKIECN